MEHGLQGLARAFGQAFAGDDQLGLRRVAASTGSALRDR
jgi:hypothetical protein